MIERELTVEQIRTFKEIFKNVKKKREQEAKEAKVSEEVKGA